MRSILFHLKRIRYDFFGLVFGAVSREEFPEDFEATFDNALLVDIIGGALALVVGD